MIKPIVWTIAGSDSGGGAGIQADLHTFQQLGVHGCSVISASTAQNSVEVRDIHYLPVTHVMQQIQALADDLPARALKIGMLGNAETIHAVGEFLQQYNGTVICDPVCVASSGAVLISPESLTLLRQCLLPLVNILTPNLAETETLLGQTLHSTHDIEQAARSLQTLGPKIVIIKGGHAQGELSQDYYLDQQQGVWLNTPRLANNNNHGSGCTLAAALTAGIAGGLRPLDAMIQAKAYVQQGIRLSQSYGQGAGPVAHATWPCSAEDIPWLSQQAQHTRSQFPRCETPLGIYPLVDNLAKLQQVLSADIKTVQLRIKAPLPHNIDTIVRDAIALSQQNNAQLYINDHWQLALKHQAYGVHLGQEDLLDVDLNVLATANIRLGISCHNYEELAIAHRIRPSYIAFGPIFTTQSKILRYAPQGLAQLQDWCQLSPYPVVAVGGIDRQQIDNINACGASGIAMLSAVTSMLDVTT